MSSVARDFVTSKAHVVSRLPRYGHLGDWRGSREMQVWLGQNFSGFWDNKHAFRGCIFLSSAVMRKSWMMPWFMLNQKCWKRHLTRWCSWKCASSNCLSINGCSSGARLARCPLYTLIIIIPLFLTRRYLITYSTVFSTPSQTIQLYWDVIRANAYNETVC